MQATKRASRRLSKYMLHTLLHPNTHPTIATTTATTSATGMAHNEEVAQHQREEDYLFAEPTEGHIRIDQIADSELIQLFDLSGPGTTEGGYTSARHAGIPVPQIVGIAPSLRPYHALWRHRYALEAQLPHNWGALRQRYAWAALPRSAVRTGNLGADIRVARELCVLLRLSAGVLVEVLASGAGDIVNTLQWIQDEMTAVGDDELTACHTEIPNLATPNNPSNPSLPSHTERGLSTKTDILDSTNKYIFYLSQNPQSPNPQFPP
ncbi:hypothetical protein DFP73DRAFT_527021 [Morchella snyderi]|nr:hypothetical protein DFP73DRAFT_527021 [Morchella snyderi]